MEWKQKVDCLSFKSKEDKETIWGNEISAQLMGQSEIEIKILDSKNGPLSIQSHPNSWEMWKILEVEPGSFIIAGLAEPFTKDNNSFFCTDLLFYNVIFPKVGETYLLPKGLIHALGRGIVVLEIKPSINNETIRIYDWKRNREKQQLKSGVTWHEVCNQKEKIIKLS